MIKQKIKYITSALAVTGVFILSFSNSVTYAAACANPSNYGYASWTAVVPDAGTYEIWARVMVPDANNDSFQLEIDGANCWQMGGTAIPASTWTWVNWHNNSTSQIASYTFASSGNHTVKIIGSSANVQVDKVILLGDTETCSDGGSAPSGNGDNCATAPAATSTPTTPSSTPTETVTGTTTPDIVAQNQDNAAQTSYVVNGQVIQTSDGAAALDTSKLEDGTYTIEAIVKLKDGTEVKQQYTITVDNHKSFLESYAYYIYGGAAIVAVVTAIVIFVLHKMGKIHLRLFTFTKHSNTAYIQQHRPIVIKPDAQHRM